jgi:zinc transporter, ZIP family
VTAISVFVAALATALATGIGALPFAFGSRGVRRWLGPANAIAGGVMLGASASLLIEGATRNVERTGIGALAGAAFVYFAYRVVGEREAHLGALHGADARKALLIVGVMTAHSAAEGVGVGAAFGDTGALGLLIAAAITVPNVP